MRYVYVIGNRVNWKVYVGQAKNPSQRKATHFYAARHGNEKPLYRSMRKHGVENFVFNVLEECVDELINEREQFWVAHFDSFNPERGYNLTSGGNQHFFVSEETKRKISQNNSSHRPEVKLKLSRAGKRKHTVEENEKIRQVLKRRAIELGAPFKGKKHSEEAKRRIGRSNSIAQQGTKNSQHGTCWVWNSERSMKIKRNELEFFLNTGWIKGRRMSVQT